MRSEDTLHTQDKEENPISGTPHLSPVMSSLCCKGNRRTGLWQQWGCHQESILGARQYPLCGGKKQQRLLIWGSLLKTQREGCT